MCVCVCVCIGGRVASSVHDGPPFKVQGVCVCMCVRIYMYVYMCVHALIHVCTRIHCTYIICHLSERLSGACPQHLSASGSLHVPHRHLIVATDGRDEGGGVGGVRAQLVDMVDVSCVTIR